MTDKEILQKALMKANLAWELIDEINWYELIFRHEFAKAFWGGGGHILTDTCDEFCYKCGAYPFETNTKYHWQYHLQQMVLEKEPIKYLEKFL